MTIRRPPLWKLALLTLALASLPVSALAAALPDNAQTPAGSTAAPPNGSIDLQPGAINGQVNLQPGSVSLQASLGNPGIDGNLQVAVPGQFVGSASATGGQLSYDVTACGAGVNFTLSGTTSSSFHVGFQNAATNPAACSSPASTAAAQRLMMLPLELAAQSQPGVPIFAADDQPGVSVLAADDQPGGAVLAAQAQASASDFDAGDLLANWVRRFIGFSAVALLLMLIIPAVPRAVAVATETPPWSRLGIGLAVALLLPLIGLLVFAIGLPLGLWWLGVILLALYPVA
ncbi:MAG: hypothetical protein JO057_14195, partial [Chloroflexi bacterium]|nr:hypothetical protein [Chloroflexota bacterium]